MAPKLAEATPQIRKSFLVVGGIAVATALIGLLLMTFVFGGDVTVPTEQPSEVATDPVNPPAFAPSGPDPAAERPVEGVLRPGGRDPFSPAVVVRPPAPAE